MALLLFEGKKNVIILARARVGTAVLVSRGAIISNQKKCINIVSRAFVDGRRRVSRCYYLSLKNVIILSRARSWTAVLVSRGAIISG